MSALRHLRESLGFTPEEVAQAARWPASRLASLEATDEVDDDAEVVLGDLYGTDVLAAVEQPDRTPPPVSALLRGEGAGLSAPARFAMTEATSVAREIRSLQALLGRRPPLAAVGAFQHNPDYSPPRFGGPEALAAQTRRALRIGMGPIVSVLDEVYAPLDILVLTTADLDDQVDAFCSVAPETGAVVVLNLRGPHANTAAGRRITLAHELCHVLYDRPRLQSMRRFCAISFNAAPKRRHVDEEDEIERRARAFAVWLLAPRDAMHTAWLQTGGSSIDLRVRHIMETFGIGYLAARAHLASTRRLPLRAELPPVNRATPARWERADPIPPQNAAALARGVSSLRAGALLEVLLDAWREGLIGEQYVRGALRIDIPAWEDLRQDLGFPTERTWQSLAVAM